MAKEEAAEGPPWHEGVQKGYLRMMILMLLARKPMHGYEIMNEVDERTLGLWRPTAGGIYPLLKRMEEKGEIESTSIVESGRRRRVYRITPEGRSRLEKILERQRALIDTVEGLFADFMMDALEVEGRPPKFPIFSLLKNAFPCGGLEAGTPEEKREILSSLIERLKEHRRKISYAIRKIDEKLRQLEQTTEGGVEGHAEAEEAHGGDAL
jgi:DNA-binding PadR family transcriptional regulator